MAKASLSTSLLLSHEFLNWLSGYLATKKATETEEKTAEAEKPAEPVANGEPVTNGI